jgi:hypothetical protein
VPVVRGERADAGERTHHLSAGNTPSRRRLKPFLRCEGARHHSQPQERTGRNGVVSPGTAHAIGRERRDPWHGCRTFGTAW